MTGYGVSGEDRPAGRLPSGAAGPVGDERDLDALLSGAARGLPPSLLPVAGVLAALRSAPVPGELAGEAAARAAFLAVTPGLGSGRVGAEHGTVPSAALPFPPARRDRRRYVRRRRAAWGPRGPVVVASGALVAAVLVIAVALTGGLAGSITQLAHLGRPASGGVAGTGTARPSATQRVEGGGSPVTPDRPRPTASATATAAPRGRSGPAALCRQYFARSGEPAARSALRRKLAARAGGGRAGIRAYCRPYLTNASLAGAIRPAASGQPRTGGHRHYYRRHHHHYGHRHHYSHGQWRGRPPGRLASRAWSARR